MITINADARLYATTRPYLSSGDIAALNLSATNEVCIRLGTLNGAPTMYVQVRDRAAPKARKARAPKVTGTIQHDAH